MNIEEHTFEAFLEMAREFHGYPAPGIVVGGYMVALAKRHMPEGTLFEVLCETPKCLPDAVQMLTVCTLGNGRLHTLNLGKYACSLYDKFTGRGVRVYLDPAKLDAYPELKAWYLKTKPKREQDSAALFAEIERAGEACCSVRPVAISERLLGKKSMGRITVCPSCGEPFPGRDGVVCRACLGETPYCFTDAPGAPQGPELAAVPVHEAVGKAALHDMTRIVPGESKGPAVSAGQVITGGDVCRLQQMGRSRVYLADQSPGEEWVHENDAARVLAERMAGEGIGYDPAPREGKIDFRPERQGLFVVDRERLRAFNMAPDVMCATRKGDTFVRAGKTVAGTRALPLYIARERLALALDALEHGPLFWIEPLRTARVGILVTGTEVARGLIQDKFAPIVTAKVGQFDCTVAGVRIAPDERADIAAAAQELVEAGADLLVTTAGLSVDPDDVTLKGLQDAGLTDVLRGAPILPGAMTLIGRMGETRVIGVPACALFHKTTSFDLLLPRLLAGQELSRADLADMAEGGLCLACSTCTFPKCPFGK